MTHRKLLQSKAIAIDNDLRGTLRNFGLKVGMVGKVKFEARIKETGVRHFPLRLENNLLHLVASYGEISVNIRAREGLPATR